MENKLKRYWQQQLSDWTPQKEQEGFFSLMKTFEASNLPQLEAFLNNSEQVVCLIKGSALSGKTQLCWQWFSHHIQNFHEENKAQAQQIRPIPLWIDLKRYTSVTHGKLLNVYLQQELGLTQEEVQALQQQPTVFICEGYDEWGQWQNIYVAESFQKDWPNSKLVVTCRDAYLSGFNSVLYFIPFKGDLTYKKAYQEILLPNPVLDGEITEEWLSHWFQAHAMKFKDQWQKLGIQTEAEFIDQCWNYAKQLLAYFKQGEQEMHFQPLNSLFSHTPEAIKLQLLLYGSDPLLKLLRAACHLESSKMFGFRWAHAELYEVIANFSLKKVIELPLPQKYIQLSKEETKLTAAEYTSQTVSFVKKIDKGDEVNSTDIPKCDQNSIYTQFSVDRLRCGDSKSENYRKTLLQVIGLSKTNQYVKAISTAQAMTVLAAAGISFSTMDLSGIKIAGADLQGAICGYTNFSGADLNGVNLARTYLHHANFSQAKLIDINLGEYPTLNLKNSVNAIAYSGDGHYLAVAVRKKVLLFIDLAENCDFTSFGKPLKGHTKEVTSIAFSPDGRLLISGSEDHTVRLWSIEDQNSLAIFTGHTSNVTSVAFDCTGGLIASGSLDETVRLWDMVSQQVQGILIGHTEDVTSVLFSPDGRILASAGGDETIRLWDVQSQSLIGQPLAGHRNRIASMAFSPDGRLLISGSEDHTVRLWEIQTQTSFGQPLKGNGMWVNSVAFSSNGKLLASAGSEGAIFLWDLQNQSLVGQPLSGHTKEVTSIVFSPDSYTLASGSEDGFVRFWNVQSQSLVGQPLTEHIGAIGSVTFSPDGLILASSGTDKTIRLWDVQSQFLVGHPLTGHTNEIYSVVFSPDGQILASGSADSTIRFWEIQTKTPIGQPLIGHTKLIFCVAFSSDGKILASGSADKTIRFWDVWNQSPLGQPILLGTESNFTEVYSVVFSPDGRILASGIEDGTVRFWDVQSRLLIGKPLEGHTKKINSVAFSPDGRMLASGGNDWSIRLWEVRNQALLKPLLGHTSAVNSVAFSPDGRMLASGGSDNVICVWIAVEKCSTKAAPAWTLQYRFGIGSTILVVEEACFKNAILLPLQSKLLQQRGAEIKLEIDKTYQRSNKKQAGFNKSEQKQKYEASSYAFWSNPPQDLVSKENPLTRVSVKKMS